MLIPRATVHEVAKAAGVHPSTVSRALRGNPVLPAATRERICRLAEAMGYRPDPLISALTERRYSKGEKQIGTLAYITAFPTRWGWRSSFFEGVYEGALAQAHQRGYELEHFWLREPKMTGRRLGDILRTRGIRGMLLPPLPVGYGHLRLPWEYFSTAAIGYSMIRPSLHRVTPHHFHNTLIALRAMRKAGAKKIGVLFSKETSRKVGENFLAAVYLCQQLYGRKVFPIHSADYTDPAALRRGIEPWLRQHRPDALFCSQGTVSILKRTPSLITPEMIIGTQGTAEDPTSPYPGIDEKPTLIGAAAVDLIIGQIQRNETGIPVDPKVVMVEGRWNAPQAHA